MKKLMVLLAALLLLTCAALADTHQVGIEETEYLGVNVFKVTVYGLSDEITFEVKDASGSAVTIQTARHERDEYYITLGADAVGEYTLTIYDIAVSTDIRTYTASMRAEYGTENIVWCDDCGTSHGYDACPRDTRDDDRYERCDICGQTGHDDDVCPKASGVPGQAYPTPMPSAYPTPMPASEQDDDDRYERCDICGEIGHDDDVCPNRANVTPHPYDDDDDDDDDRYERCDICGKVGHDDDDCPNRVKATPRPKAKVNPTPIPKKDKDDDRERCDICGKYGHDDDDCPKRSYTNRDRDDDDDDDDDD